MENFRVDLEVNLSLAGGVVAAVPRPDLGRFVYAAENGGRFLYLVSQDGVDAEDVTDAISAVLKADLTDGQKRSRRAGIQHRARLKLAKGMDPIDYQRDHSPVEKVMIDLGMVGGVRRRQQQGYRRVVDGHLLSSLTLDMRDVMLEIERGHRALVGRLGMKPSCFERTAGGKGELTAGQAAAVGAYNGWIVEVDNTLRRGTDGQPLRFGGCGRAAKRWTLERLVPEVATAIICEGRSVREVAADRGWDRAKVMDVLKQALTVWLWRTHRVPRPLPIAEADDPGLTLKQTLIRQRNRRVDKMVSVIEERARVIRPRAAGAAL